MKTSKSNNKNHFKKYPIYLLIIQTWIFLISTLLSNYKIIGLESAYFLGFFASIIAPEIYYLVRILKDKKDDNA